MLAADGVAIHKGEQVQELPVRPGFVVLKRYLLLIRLIPERIVNLNRNRKLCEGGRVRSTGVFAQILLNKKDAFLRSVNKTGQLCLYVKVSFAHHNKICAEPESVVLNLQRPRIFDFIR